MTNTINLDDILTPTDETPADDRPKRRPPWIKVRAPSGETYEQVRQLMRAKHLNTVCEEAMCPNMGECWGAGTSTFLMLGDTCTRSCGFCDIKTGRPGALDWQEPNRVADAVKASAEELEGSKAEVQRLREEVEGLKVELERERRAAREAESKAAKQQQQAVQEAVKAVEAISKSAQERAVARALASAGVVQAD